MTKPKESYRIIIDILLPDIERRPEQVGVLVDDLWLVERTEQFVRQNTGAREALDNIKIRTYFSEPDYI